MSALGLRPRDMEDFAEVSPQTVFRDDRRGLKYHQGRIHYFVQCLQDGIKLDPISIDNDCGHNLILPIPVVLDGNHRFIAHIILGIPRIPAHYGGRVDLLRYLEGKRMTPPKD